MGAYARLTLPFRIGLLGLFLALAACAGNPPPAGPTAAELPVDPDTAVGLKPGDVVRLQVHRDTTLGGEFQVNENGAAVLPILGRREVAGLTPDSLRTQLLAEYGEYYKDPVMDVTVLRRISILGAVKKPGLYPVDPTVSLSEALALAGGMTPLADADDIRLIRSGRVLREDLDRATLVGTTPSSPATGCTWASGRGSPATGSGSAARSAPPSSSASCGDPGVSPAHRALSVPR